MVAIIENTRLRDQATGTQTSTVGEPTVATSGQRVFVTGNWFASRSTDGGRSWRFLDPFTEFPSDSGEFCCDQIAYYSSRQRVWVWFLQYSQLDSSNLVRLAVSRTGAPGTWTWRDLRPVDVDPGWTAVWFDYPDLAESDGHLFVSCNVYDASDAWVAAAVVRYPSEELASGGPVTRRTWTTTSFGSLRFVQGADDTMWFAAHTGDTEVVRLFSWPDSATRVAAFSVAVGPWSDAPYSSRGPGGAEWLTRMDSRITGGFRTVPAGGGGLLGFSWTAAPGDGRPHPYVRVVRIDESTLRVHDEPDLWSTNGAWAYPATAPNRRGRIGMSAFFGGPSHPAHAVGWLDEDAGRWTMAMTAVSTHGPAEGKWGDYVVCRSHPRKATAWIATGFTLDGGADRRDVEPRVVVFRP
jgi:hypothetical protein